MAVVGTTLASTANAAPYQGSFFNASTPLTIPVPPYARHYGCGSWYRRLRGGGCTFIGK
jgi:hypothetical protein